MKTEGGWDPVKEGIAEVWDPVKEGIAEVWDPSKEGAAAKSGVGPKADELLSLTGAALVDTIKDIRRVVMPQAPSPAPAVPEVGDMLVKQTLEQGLPMAAGALAMAGGLSAPAAPTAAAGAAATGKVLSDMYSDWRAGQPISASDPAQVALAGGIAAAATALPAVRGVQLPQAVAVRAPILAAAAEAAPQAAVGGVAGFTLDGIYQAATKGEIDWGQALQSGGTGAALGLMSGAMQAYDAYGAAQANRAKLIDSARQLFPEFKGENWTDLKTWVGERMGRQEPKNITSVEKGTSVQQDGQLLPGGARNVAVKGSPNVPAVAPMGQSQQQTGQPVAWEAGAVSIGRRVLPNGVRSFLDKTEIVPSVLRDLWKIATSAKPDARKAIVYGRVGAEEAAVMRERVNVDVADYIHTVDNYALAHIMEQHGSVDKERARGQYPITQDDVALLPQITLPENLVRTETGKRGQMVLVYEKQIGGTVIAVEEVRTGRRELALQSMRKKVAQGSTPAITSPSRRAEISTSETTGGTLAPPDTMLDPRESVNPSPVGGSDAGVAGMIAPPPGAATGMHRTTMPVAMDRIMPGKVDAPTVMNSLTNVISTLGGEVPMRTGRFNQQAYGIYKSFSRVIRLREADDIPTAAHEVAHAVSHEIFGGVKDKQLIRAMGPGTKLAQDELHKLGRALYGGTRPVAGYHAEGFSELVRLWMTTEDAAKVAPAATRWLEDVVLPAHPEMAAALKGAREKVDLWRGQGAEGRATAQMKDPPGRLQRLRELVRDNFGRQAQVEEFAPLEELVAGYRKIAKKDLPPHRNPFMLASAFRKTAGATLETMVDRGMVDLWGNKVGPGLKEALAPVQPDQAEKFAHYLWARRALERWKKQKNPGMALEDARYLRAKLETPAFVAAAEKYYQWWDGVLEYVKSASPDTNGPLIDAIRAKSRDYVPLARVLDPGQAKTAAMLAQGGGLYRFKGSGLPIKNIYLQSLLVAERLIARAHRDLVLDSVLNLSSQPGMGWLVEKVPRSVVMESVSIDKIRAQLEDYGIDTTDIPEDTLLKYATHLDVPNGFEPIIARKTLNGVEWYQVPAEVYDLLQGVEAPARLGWAFELLMGAPARAFKLGTTGLRASFSLVTNPARDFTTYLLQGTAGNPASQAAAWTRSMAEIVTSMLGGKETPELEAFHRLGISASNFLGGDVQQAKRQAKALFHGRLWSKMASPVETARDVLSFSEAAPRLAEMRKVGEEMGWTPGQRITPEQAVAMRVAAKRVTTDFSAAGTVGREINRAIPFYNAAIQGTRAFARTAQASKLRAILKGLTMLTMPALFLWWENKDKDWYRMLPWRERWLYLNVPTPNGGLVQVPLPPDWGSAFAVLPVATFDSWYMQDPEPAQQALSHIFDVMNPVDYPVLAKAAKEQWQNRIDFFNRPIVPRGEVDLLPGEQRGHYSSWLAGVLGDAFPGQVSPRRFDAAVRSVFGGAGADLVDAPTALMRALGLKVQSRDSELADLPIAGRLFRRGGQFSAANQSLIDFWDDYDRYTAQEASYTHHLKLSLSGERGAVPPPPMQAIMYANMLKAAQPFLKMTLEMAARTPEDAARQKLYNAAAKMAETVVASGRSAFAKRPGN